MNSKQVLLLAVSLVFFSLITLSNASADTNLSVTIVTAPDDPRPVEKVFIEVKDLKGKLLASGYTNKTNSKEPASASPPCAASSTAMAAKFGLKAKLMVGRVFTLHCRFSE